MSNSLVAKEGVVSKFLSKTSLEKKLSSRGVLISLEIIYSIF